MVQPLGLPTCSLQWRMQHLRQQQGAPARLALLFRGLSLPTTLPDQAESRSAPTLLLPDLLSPTPRKKNPWWAFTAGLQKIEGSRKVNPDGLPPAMARKGCPRSNKFTETSPKIMSLMPTGKGIQPAGIYRNSREPQVVSHPGQGEGWWGHG